MDVTVSIVSHGHHDHVRALCRQLAEFSGQKIAKVVVTSNVPQLDNFLEQEKLDATPSELVIVQNPLPLGFGANHNRAFELCDTPYFCVLNPDVSLDVQPFDGLLRLLTDDRVGCAYPLQVNASLLVLDSERTLATPWAIVRRHLPWFGTRLKQADASARLDEVKPVHWVNGAFMLFRSDVFRQLGGFDERYFMYCEDVDICLRLQSAGYTLARADATVIHDTRRRTLRDFRHFSWHITSLFRLWNSQAYRDFKRRFVV